MMRDFYLKLYEINKPELNKRIIQDEISDVEFVRSKTKMQTSKFYSSISLMVISLIVAIILFLLNEESRIFSTYICGFLAFSIVLYVMWFIVFEPKEKEIELSKYKYDLIKLSKKTTQEISKEVAKKITELNDKFQPLLEFDGPVTELLVLSRRFKIKDRAKFRLFVVKNIKNKDGGRYKLSTLQQIDNHLVSGDKDAEKPKKALSDFFTNLKY